MAKVFLITGGSRSGKSAYAQRIAEALAQPRVFIATAPVLDGEMRERIRKHREARAGRGWETTEEQVDVAPALQRSRYANVILVDCLTLWINNLMFEAQQQQREVSEEDVAQHCREILAACADHPGTVVFVTNELGTSIVPDNALCRRYRDLVGRCNQTIAASADAVILMACGLPLPLKGQLPETYA